jgi:hypothetical protein
MQKIKEIFFELIEYTFSKFFEGKIARSQEMASRKIFGIIFKAYYLASFDW